MAARLSAIRVAAEHGEEVGQRIGYHVRFDKKLSRASRIRFVTEQLFVQMILTDPMLDSVGAVVLDEFHERHLASDLALALVNRLRKKRPELVVVVMSATIDPDPVAAFLNCTVVHTAGRQFPVEVSYQAATGTPRRRAFGRGSSALSGQVTSAISSLEASAPLDGDVLVFLPGVREISDAAAACQQRLKNKRAIPLHGRLSLAEQDRALSARGEPVIILSTNVAETSVTVPRVTAVIDCGTARVPRHDPYTGISTLALVPISRASADQRAGRAGRTRPGRCIRLYGEADYRRRDPAETPEIARADLAELALSLLAADIEIGALDWLLAPNAEALSAAQELLTMLGVCDKAGQLTRSGREIAALPIHPRLAKLATTAAARGAATSGCLLAAIASEAAIGQTTNRDELTAGPSDLIASLEPLLAATGPSLRLTADAARRYGLRFHSARQVVRVAAQLRERLDKTIATDANSSEADEETALLIATLAGFPDRLASRRSGTARKYLLAAGSEASLANSSVVGDFPGAAHIVCVDVGRRQGRQDVGRNQIIYRASIVDPDWILELFLDDIDETTELEWNRSRERVEIHRRVSFRGLVLEAESRAATADDGPSVAACLAASVADAGIDTLVDKDALAEWRARVGFAAGCDTSIPAVTDDDINKAVGEFCTGKTRFAELRSGLLGYIQLARANKTAAIDRLAPTHVAIPGRQRVPVHYTASGEPWIESRLQDFFGSVATPCIGGGRVPLVLHLLAPNMRAIQVTRDLANFWKTHYPALRKQLSRRYPRHGWPDDPQTAKPSRPTPRKRR